MRQTWELYLILREKLAASRVNLQNSGENNKKDKFCSVSGGKRSEWDKKG